MASLVVPVTFRGLRGAKTLRTLIDTGAEMSLIPRAAAKEIGIPIFGEVSVKGAGRAVVEVGRVSGIHVPGARLCNTGPMMVWVFDKGAIFPGTGIHAILGYDFMKKARMEIAAFTRTRALRCKMRKK
jgi:hypothetical protein